MRTKHKNHLQRTASVQSFSRDESTALMTTIAPWSVTNCCTRCAPQSLETLRTSQMQGQDLFVSMPSEHHDDCLALSLSLCLSLRLLQAAKLSPTTPRAFWHQMNVFLPYNIIGLAACCAVIWYFRCLPCQAALQCKFILMRQLQCSPAEAPTKAEQSHSSKCLQSCSLPISDYMPNAFTKQQKGGVSTMRPITS